MSDTYTPEAPSEAAESAPSPADAARNAQEAKATDSETADNSADRDLEAARKLRSENKALRDRLKAAEPLVKAAQEAEDAKKDSAQKSAEAIQAAQQEATTEREQRVRLELAIDYKIPKEGVALIGSGSFEDMERNAKVVGELFAAKSKTAPPPTDRPVEGLRPGASPGSPKPADDSYPEAWKPRHLKEKESRSQYGQ